MPAVAFGPPIPGSEPGPRAYWARRRFFDSIQEAIRQEICKESAIKAKEYRRLVNDALFFEPDPRDRFAKLLGTHLGHRRLARSAAAETEGKPADFEDPPSSNAFTQALFYGKHLPVQACMYYAHRARLYVLKAAVDTWLGRQQGTLPKSVVKIAGHEFDLGDSRGLRGSVVDADEHEVHSIEFSGDV